MVIGWNNGGGDVGAYGGISCVMTLIALVLCFVPYYHVLSECSSAVEGVSYAVACIGAD